MTGTFWLKSPAPMRFAASSIALTCPESVRRMLRTNTTAIRKSATSAAASTGLDASTPASSTGPKSAMRSP